MNLPPRVPPPNRPSGPDPHAVPGAVGLEDPSSSALHLWRPRIEELKEDGSEDPFVLADNELEDAATWRILPVHPKLALLFLRGMLVLAAGKLVQELVEIIPHGDTVGVQLLVDFCRAAFTATGATSSQCVNWETVNTMKTDQVFEWCQGLKNQYFLHNTTAPFHAPPMEPGPALAAPMCTLNEYCVNREFDSEGWHGQELVFTENG